MSNYKVIATENDGFKNDYGNMGSYTGATDFARRLLSDDDDIKCVDIWLLRESGASTWMVGYKRG